MKRNLTFLVSLLLVMVSATGCFGAQPAGASDISSRKIKAVTTIGQIGDLVKNVGGDRVEVVPLMGPGVDPHLYKASESDISKLSSADIIFYNGLNLEGKMGDLFVRMARTKPTIPVTETIPEKSLREPPEMQGHADPHVWFDVTLWRHTVDRVEQALAQLDPQNAAKYKTNADNYRKQLDELHNFVTSQINTIPPDQRVLVTAHDAFGYFGAQYAVEVVGLQGISTESEAGVKDVQDLANLIASKKVKAIFVESSVPHRNIEAVRAAAKSKGQDVIIGGELYSDALGDPGTPAGTYVGMIRHNVETIVKALK
ncbi:MAG: zinc ABC transporter substrate-binding protein [Chloroflexi bacterium]|nr:zinc ABC transporter substrate-binding protein [Chloroflexota bacterium]